MKHILVSFSFFLLCYTVTEAQTYANVPGPENVLVVYNELDSTSLLVANYYITARNIPAVNVVGLDSLVDKEITIGRETHWVGLRQGTDIIQDIHQNSVNAINPTFHAWLYFNERIV